MTRTLERDKEDQANNEQRREELLADLRPLSVRLNELNGYMESMRVAIHEMGASLLMIRFTYKRWHIF